MADINNQNPNFLEFMFQGLDHGIDSIKESGGPLTPYIMTLTDDKKDMKRFVTEMYEDGIIEAEKVLIDMEEKPEFALLAFDGFINWEGQKYDAIIVRAYDKTQSECFEFCQRYRSKENEKGIEAIGNSAFLGKSKNIIFKG